MAKEFSGCVPSRISKGPENLKKMTEKNQMTVKKYSYKQEVFNAGPWLKFRKF